MRKVCYVSGTRADFGLMRAVLLRASADPRLSLSICVTGTHLLPHYGETVREIEAAGLSILARVPVRLDGSSGAVMARALADQLAGMSDAFATARPDIVVVLGDRGEMLAGALAAIHLNVPVVHIHGGELSGTVDEPIRHAISKLAHYHFVSTEGARQRLIRMGECPEHIFVSGAPGLDGLQEAVTATRSELSKRYGLDPARRIALMVFHPVLQEANAAGSQAADILAALENARCQVLCLMPNSDAGGQRIEQTLQEWSGKPDVLYLDHLPRDEYLAWMAAADLLIGNSSSGIIEAASFALPVVNVGQRQKGRERSDNVFDASNEPASIRAALAAALARGKAPCRNIYGDGHAAQRIVEWLATLPLTPDLLVKSNAY